MKIGDDRNSTTAAGYDAGRTRFRLPPSPLEVNMNLKVSILIPYYGNRYYQLQKSLHFLCNQTYKNYEILLLDDGKRNDADHSPDDLLQGSEKITHWKLRHGKVPIRSSNMALREGYYLSDGDFIITVQPELLIPYNAVEIMVKGNLERRNVATQYHLTNNQINYLYGDGIVSGWMNDFDKIKNIVDFMSTVTPWNHTNFHAPTYRNHFSFSGSTKERFGKYLIPQTAEWMMEDAWVHEQETNAGESAVPIDIEVYHQEHERIYGTITEKSVRIQRIQDSNLK